MLFEIYTTDVEIDGEKYTLRPLSGRYIGKLYSVIGKLQTEDEKDLLKQLDEETMGNFYDIALATFEKSYPDQPKDKLEDFVSQKLIKLIEPIVKVNIGEIKEN